VRRDVEHEVRDALDARADDVLGPAEVDGGEGVGELERWLLARGHVREVQGAREADGQPGVLCGG
jgi:hypothetical protein